MNLGHQNSSTSNLFDTKRLEFNRGRLGRLVGRQEEEKRKEENNYYNSNNQSYNNRNNREKEHNANTSQHSNDRKVDFNFRLTDEHRKNILSKMAKVLTNIETFLEVRIKFSSRTSLDSLRYKDFIREYDKLASEESEGVEAKKVILYRIEKASHSISEFSYFGNYVLPNYAVTLNKGFLDKLIVIGSEMYTICYDISRAFGPSAISWGSMEVSLASLIDRYEEENNFSLSNDYMYRIYRLLLLSLHNSDVISAKIFATFIVQQVDILRESAKAGGKKYGA